jgi:hypothetical protein
MSPIQVVIQGTLHPDGTLELDEKPNLPPGKVQVMLQPVQEPGPTGPGWWDALQKIWKEQDARGFKRRSREEIDAQIAAERAEEEEYEERWRQIWAQTQPPPATEDKP